MTEDKEKDKKADKPEDRKSKGRHYVLEVQDAVHGAKVKKDMGG